MKFDSSLFKDKNYLWLWLGQTLSVVAHRFCNIAFMWYVIETTGSSIALGLSVICFSLPAIFCLPFSGVLADKNHKKQILLVSNIINGVLILLIAYSVFIDYSMILLYALVIASSIASAFFSPALSASIPLLVDKSLLPNANSLSQMTQQLANILGPALAGILIAVTDIWVTFAISGVAFLLAVLFHSRITIRSVESTDVEGHFFQQFKDGLVHVLSSRKLIFLIIAGGVIINFFLAPITVYITFIANQILEIGSQGLGILQSSISVGALVGGLLIFTNVLKDKIKMAIFGLTIEGVALLLAGLFPGYLTMMTFFLILGLGVSLASVGITTLFQTIVPENKMGRVMSLLSTMSFVTVPLGTMLGSVLIDQISVYTVLLVSGICVALTGIALCYPFANELRTNKEKEASLSIE
ncbi:MFS transporter [Bacillus horti]|uniref:MFS family permease n=1 Tax=Caldalkalibacillus horti TaxID=77523 RepID=A0ABT9VZC6_9BACI|nr:MFS transporter [Bacillus horti]MDQ0165960.1 MFS family permease [Bacillus horti]